MDFISRYFQVFITGGALCLIGQLLINYTKLTSARILVIFLLAGVLFQALNIYQPVVNFGGAGATVPIIGFGYSLAKGAMKGAKESFLKALTGGFEAVCTGIGAAMFFGYLFALICRSHTKKV